MPNEIQEIFNRKEFFAQEKEVIDILINWSDKDGLYDLRHLNHFVTPDLDIQEYMDIKGLYIATNILRQELEFNKDEKPGDFDLIIIPFTKNEIFFERTAACEVKIVRPTRKNPLRNSNSLGTTQLNGLIQDGFPFIGLMHISITEPLKDFEKFTVDFCTLAANSDDRIEEGKKFEDYLTKVKVDNFPWFSADKQLQRLISCEIPKYVGLMCLGLTQNNKEKFSFHSVSQKYTGLEMGYFNPHRKKETIQKIIKHFEKNPLKYAKKLMRK
jgi:hypothetical protein